MIFTALVHSEKLPPPFKEYKFHHSRKWRFDYAWPDQKIALEVEGGVWTGGRHTRGAGFMGDIEKYNEAAILGWRVLRTTPSELLKVKTVQLLKRVLTVKTITQNGKNQNKKRTSAGRD